MKRVVIIGGGPAGMQTAIRLHDEGLKPLIIEKEKVLGGKLKGWYHLFPTLTPAAELLQELRARVQQRDIKVMTSTTVDTFTNEEVTLSDGRHIECRAVVVCTGSTLFDATRKEEYGYGIYNNVITSVDLEQMLSQGSVSLHDGRMPERIALLHCVGSRDEKVCQSHCSKVCCVTGVKQAMELRRLFPNADIVNFYMDIRMFGPGYEEMYKTAQQRDNIHFVRGRISETSPTFDGRIQIKAEDTLTGRPLRISVDMLVLLVGMTANEHNITMEQQCGLERSESGFMRPKDMFLNNTLSSKEGIFYAGCVTAPKNIGESLNEGSTAALAVKNYIA